MESSEFQAVNEVKKSVVQVKFFRGQNFCSPPQLVVDYFVQLTKNRKKNIGNVCSLRVDKLKRIVAIWKHWNLYFDTPKKFYETGWIDTKYGETEKLHFLDFGDSF